MRLAILISRRSNLKILSSVVDAALRRKHDVTLLAQPRAAKPGDGLDLREIRTLWPRVPIVNTMPRGLDAMIGPAPFLPDLKTLPLIGVDQFFDCWAYPATRGPNFTLCYPSEYARDVHRELWPDQRNRGAVVGWTVADQRVPEQARDSVVFYTLKLDVPEAWRQSKAGREQYRAMYYATQEWARVQGLRLIIKTRGKNKDPWWMRWGHDGRYADDVMVPYRSLTLLARAKYAVHFESGAGLEAALMGAYSVALLAPQSHVKKLPGGDRQYGGVAMHDWPGVACYGLPAEERTVDPEQRAKYLAHYVGLCDGRAGERVLDVVEGV